MRRTETVQNAVLCSHNTSPAGSEACGIWRSGFPGTSHKTSSARCSRPAHRYPTDTILYEWQTGSSRVLPGGQR